MHNYNKDYKKSETPVVEEVVEETVVEEVAETVDEVVEETTEAAETVYGVVCNCEKLNIRKSPNTASDVNILCKVPAGSRLIIGAETSDGEWLNVCTETGAAGFAMKEYIRIET